MRSGSLTMQALLLCVIMHLVHSQDCGLTGLFCLRPFRIPFSSTEKYLPFPFPPADKHTTVPAAPLTAAGLTTPYVISTLLNSNGTCSQLNPATAVFIEATIVDLNTGKLFVYNPIVVDDPNQLNAPIPPITLPRSFVVGIWFHTNAKSISLLGNNVKTGQCVMGVPGSNFGTSAYCNAPAFYAAVNKLIDAGTIVVPPPGVSNHGAPCPTIRSFATVDANQGAGVLSSYIITTGKLPCY
jgi:hypothetical protein